MRVQDWSWLDYRWASVATIEALAAFFVLWVLIHLVRAGLGAWRRPNRPLPARRRRKLLRASARPVPDPRDRTRQFRNIMGGR